MPLYNKMRTKGTVIHPIVPCQQHFDINISAMPFLRLAPYHRQHRRDVVHHSLHHRLARLEAGHPHQSGERSPSFDTILKVVSALGLKLSADVRSEAEVT
jgi:hypothetical protein